MEQENRRYCDGLAGIWGSFYRLLSAVFTINGQLKPIFIGVIWNFLKKLCRSGNRGGTERFPGVCHMYETGRKIRGMWQSGKPCFFLRYSNFPHEQCELDLENSIGTKLNLLKMLKNKGKSLLNMV
jgi:hypothetical protein